MNPDTLSEERRGSRSSARLQRFFGKRLAFLGLATAVCAVLSLFADQHWTLDLLTSFTWHYAFGGGVLSGLLLWLHKPYWALPPALAALVGLSFGSGFEGAPARSCPGGGEWESLRILQFNVGRENGRADAFYGWLKQQGSAPDLIVLFEVTDRFEASLQHLQTTLWPQVLKEYRRDNFGIAVASRLPDASLALVPIGDPPLPGVVVTRSAGESRGIPFTLVAAHAPPPLTGELAAVRNRHFAALAGRIADAPESNRILVGDLNVTPFSPWFGRLLSQGRLRDAQADAGRAGTFPTFGLPSALAISIDHTLISPDILVRERKVGPGWTLGSDHRPVVTELLLTRCHRE